MGKEYKIKHAVLIDDEELDQYLYQRVIDRSGLVESFTAFSSAKEALEFLRHNRDNPVDVIFLDINMPLMNGFEFLETATTELGESFAKIVVVMLTTSLNPADLERAYKFEVVKEFFNKPLALEHLQHIANLLKELEENS